jgi:hypothetical protein
LRIEFQRHADRYAHQIICTAADGSQVIWASQEGTSAETWPSSSPLQSLHVETRPDGSPTIMLVGMAGRSHWSMSVEAPTEQNQLLFDVACRVSEPPHWLGSTYKCLSETTAPPLNHFPFTVWHGDLPESNLPLQLDQSTGVLRIPAPPHLEKFPQTIRWRYAIGISE